MEHPNGIKKSRTKGLPLNFDNCWDGAVAESFFDSLKIEW